MNLPNLITMARLVLTAIFVAAASFDNLTAHWIALVAFIIAAISDFLDGYLARKMNLVTSLGKLLDPLADKVLVVSAFVILSSRGLCPNWVTCLILTREFLITGLRQIAIEKGQVLAADNLGKWKTTFQLIFIISCLCIPTFAPLNAGNPFVSLIQTISEANGVLYHLSLWIGLALALISGFNYMWRSRQLVLED